MAAVFSHRSATLKAGIPHFPSKILRCAKQRTAFFSMQICAGNQMEKGWKQSFRSETIFSGEIIISGNAKRLYIETPMSFLKPKKTPCPFYHNFAPLSLQIHSTAKSSPCILFFIVIMLWLFPLSNKLFSVSICRLLHSLSTQLGHNSLHKVQRPVYCEWEIMREHSKNGADKKCTFQFALVFAPFTFHFSILLFAKCSKILLSHSKVHSQQLGGGD